MITLGRTPPLPLRCYIIYGWPLKIVFLLWKSVISQLYLNSVTHHPDSGFDGGTHAGWGNHNHGIDQSGGEKKYSCFV